MDHLPKRLRALSRVRKSVLAVVVTGCLSVFVAVPVASAQAAQPGRATTVARQLPTAVSPSASPTPTPTPSGGDTLASSDGVAADTITCTLNVQNPHNSTHVPENVNVVATISCTKAVTSLTITVTLYFNGSPVATGTGSSALSSSVKANAATPCVNGTYQGSATGTVTFPPGYYPPSGVWPVIWGNSAAITC